MEWGGNCGGGGLGWVERSWDVGTCRLACRCRRRALLAPRALPSQPSSPPPPPPPAPAALLLQIQKIMEEKGYDHTAAFVKPARDGGGGGGGEEDLGGEGGGGGGGERGGEGGRGGFTKKRRI